MDLSIIIPSRNERFLARTVQDIFEKARGEFEVIVILDEQDQPLEPREGLKVLKKEGKPGLRSAINQGVGASNGKYIMKCDAHVMFAEGFDLVLKEYMEDNWVVIPRRYSLNGHTWTIKPDRPIIDYEYMPFPYRTLTSVRHGGKWYERAADREELLLDEEMAFQGSCWFTTKKHLENIGGFDINTSTGDEFVLESEELANKTWLSGGKVMVNKRTWYAHLYKGKEWGRGYHFDRESAKRQRLFHIDYWMHDRWPKAIHKMEWLIDRFWPIPTWPEDWQDPKYERQFMITNKLVKNPELEFIKNHYSIQKKGRNKLICSRSWTFPRIIKRLGYKVGAEVGVERAVYSKVICSRVPGIKMYGIDPWERYEGYRDHVSQKHLDEFYESAKNRMKDYDYTILRKTSKEASKDFKDGTLDFVYIDAMHDYDSVKEDIALWHPKVRRGGIVAGHDYMNGMHTGAEGDTVEYGVKQALHEWIEKQGIEYFFVLTKDKSPSWFYVRT